MLSFIGVWRVLFGIVLASIMVTSLQGQGTLISVPNPRRAVFSHGGQYLYVSCADGLVRRYNTTTRRVDLSYSLGGSLTGIDISPDNSFLLVNHYDVTAGTVKLNKIDLQTGAITSLFFSPFFPPFDRGLWDVAITSNGYAFATGGILSGVTLLKIDTKTNTFNETPIYPVDPNGNDRLYRSADSRVVYILPGNVSAATVGIYDAATDSFGPGADVEGIYLDGGACGAVNRNGSLLATRRFNRVTLETTTGFKFKHGYIERDGGLAFDGVRDILYATESVLDQIIAYDTNNYTELFRLNIGENIETGIAAFGSGNLVASDDGRFIALQTPTGIRLFVLPAGNPTPHPTPLPSPSFAKRRGMIFDHSNRFLYVSTTDGLIERYNLETSTLEHAYNPGGSLNGMDIAPDDSFLLVAQEVTGLVQSMMHRIDLQTGSITDITFNRENLNFNRYNGDLFTQDLVVSSTLPSGLTELRCSPPALRCFDS